jgi:hypothetical protein
MIAQAPQVQRHFNLGNYWLQERGGGILWRHSGDGGRAIIAGSLFRFFDAQGVTGLNIYSLIVAELSIYRFRVWSFTLFWAEMHLTCLSSRSSSNRRSCRERS